MRAADAPVTPQIRLHPDADAVEVQALYRGVVIGSRCLTAEDAGAFLIGCAKGVDAPAAAGLLGSDAHPLVTRDASGFSVGLTEQMKGTVIFEDHTAPLEDLLRAQGSFTTPPAARLQIACGDIAFLVGATTRPPTVPRPALARLRDHWPWLVAAIGMLFMMMFVAFLPPDMLAITGGLDGAAHKPMPIPFIPTVTPPPPLLARGPAGNAPRPGAAGVGSPTRRPTPARRVPRPRATGPEDVAQHGLLGVLLAYQGDSLAPLFDKDDRLQAGSFEGLIDGSGTGPNGTGIGLGPTGTGAGGGSGPLAGIGPGGLGTCGASCQIAAGNADRLPGRKPKQVQITVGVAHAQGSLDRDIVRRIIRQHLNEVKYCYEQQLPRHPDLAGRISVQFTIASGGNVTASLMQSSSLNNVAVESCIVQAVRRWEFPARPSGMTIVSYPFVLVPAGS